MENYDVEVAENPFLSVNIFIQLLISLEFTAEGTKTDAMRARRSIFRGKIHEIIAITSMDKR